VPVILGCVLGCAALFVIGDRALVAESERVLDRTANGVERRLAARLSESRVEERRTELASALRGFVESEDLLGVVLFDDDRAVMAAAPIGISRRDDLSIWPGDGPHTRRMSLDGVPAEARFVELADSVGVAAGAWIAIDRQAARAAVTRYRMLAAAAGGFAMVIGLFLAASAGRGVVRPLAGLTDVAAQLSRGDLSVRYKENGPAEIQRLARQINRIAEQLEGSQVERSRASSQIDGKVRGRTRYLEQTNRALIDLANRDPLTGLANRRRLEIELDRHLEFAREAQQPFAVIMMDLDRFKQYNDTAGHLAGDELLQSVAAALRARTRITDLVVRWGGDEFCILIPHTTPDRAIAAAESLVEAVTEATRSLPLPDDVDKPGASAGVACYPHDAEDGKELIAHADAALYQVKESGRGRVLRLEPE
jgi:diguanylate cyclase (GGDEF)-like protein